MGDSNEEADPLLLDGIASPNSGDEAEDYEEDFLFDLGSDDTILEDVHSCDDTTDGDDGKDCGSGSYDNAMFRNVVDAGDRYTNTSLDEFWSIANKTFASEEDAFLFYNEYARLKGFGVRKERVRRSKVSGAMIFRRFVCCKEGERHAKWLNKEDYSHRPRALTRCDCSALLDIKLNTTLGVWYVHNFEDEGNHLLATPNEVSFLRSHRNMKDFLKNEIMSMEVGMEQFYKENSHRMTSTS